MRVVALDAFGSDNAPFPEVEGAVIAINENLCDKIYLVGKEDILKAELNKFFYDTSKIEIVHASQIISMSDSPSIVAKSKKDSSLLKAIKLHKDGIANAVVSAGNTGAVMAASLFTYGRIKNIIRPAIAIALPTQKDPAIILDVGANVDSSSDMLVQYAKLGSLYSKFFFEINKPKVALLNIGEESSKGNDLAKNTFKKLSTFSDINFVGNIEGKDLLKGETDVVVCDGFVGNVMLKTVEGVALAIFGIMKEQMKKDWIAKLGAMLSYPVYAYLKRKLDHSEYGGALLVGLNGISIITHGRANAKAIKNAVKVAVHISESGFIEHCKKYFEGTK